jgi:precorrin-2 dehydrogenase / sirohydrochlorin ferrochelatase
VNHFPILLDVRDRKAVVIGGGKIAERRVRQLLRCGARVFLISPRATPWLASQARSGKIDLRRGLFRPRDLSGAFLIMAATDDQAAQRRIGSRAKTGRSLVNVADRPEMCNFIMPSVLRKGDLTIAVSTGGKSPAAPAGAFGKNRHGPFDVPKMGGTHPQTGIEGNPLSGSSPPHFLPDTPFRNA